MWWRVRADGVRFRVFLGGNNDDYDDDHDGTRMIRINTDDVSLEKSSTKVDRSNRQVVRMELNS